MGGVFASAFMIYEALSYAGLFDFVATRTEKLLIFYAGLRDAEIVALRLYTGEIS